jgi:hypothetical protein
LGSTISKIFADTAPGGCIYSTVQYSTVQYKYIMATLSITRIIKVRINTDTSQNRDVPKQRHTKRSVEKYIPLCTGTGT